ncbi:hypothetical protein OE09_2600 [Flavobacteriaceae bacterium MAR_2010_72]|nr:hypothetical protein OE09_2600 [Flavobacteriaceae bacterium MAR_2010_72]
MFGLFKKKILSNLSDKNRKILNVENKVGLNSVKSYQRIGIEIYPIIIPAIVADINEAIVPPIKAFIPNSDNSFR